MQAQEAVSRVKVGVAQERPGSLQGALERDG